MKFIARFLLIFSTSCLAFSGPSDLNIYAIHNPPYSMTTTGKLYAHKAKDVEGVCSEIVKAVMDNSGLSYKIKLRSFNNAYSKVRNKENSAIYCLYSTPEREEKFYSVGPLFKEEWALMAKPGSGIQINSLQEAAGYTIGGDGANPIVKYLVEQGIPVKTSDRVRGHAKMLELGKIDLWAASPEAANYMASEESNLDGLKKVFVYKVEGEYVFFNKNTDRNTIETIRNSYNDIKKSGSLKNIITQNGLEYYK